MFDVIPIEILYHIDSYVSLDDHISLRSASQHLYTALTNPYTQMRRVRVLLSHATIYAINSVDRLDRECAWDIFEEYICDALIMPNVLNSLTRFAFVKFNIRKFINSLYHVIITDAWLCKYASNGILYKLIFDIVYGIIGDYAIHLRDLLPENAAKMINQLIDAGIDKKWNIGICEVYRKNTNINDLYLINKIIVEYVYKNY